MLTVGELKKVIAALPDDTLVGVSGYFGEFYTFCSVPRAKNYINEPKNPWGWNREPVPEYQGLTFEVIDIGPEPD